MLPSPTQVAQLAPDPRALGRARATASPGKWEQLGQGAAAIWGQCRGSGAGSYAVAVDLTDFGTSCTCPSRLFPCKHALALLILASERPERLPVGEPAPFAQAWLTRRRAPEEESAPHPPVDAGKEVARATSRSRTSSKREASVSEGLERLDLWLRDLVRHGLADLDSRADSFWQQRARALVDAKAAGLGRRIGWLAEIPGSHPGWPQHLLDRLGVIALMVDAWGREADLPDGLRADLRAAIGIHSKRAEVEETGEAVTDAWLVASQEVTEGDDGLLAQRIWLLGTHTGRAALLRRYARPPGTFGLSYQPGTVLPATLRFWPSAWPQRALVADSEAPTAWTGDRLPGHDRIDGLLAEAALAVAAVPWVGRLPGALRGVVPVLDDGARWLRDAAGHGVRLSHGDHWALVGVAGGAPVDVFGEWDGRRLHPRSVVADGRLVRLDVSEV